MNSSESSEEELWEPPEASEDDCGDSSHASVGSGSEVEWEPEVKSKSVLQLKGVSAVESGAKGVRSDDMKLSTQVELASEVTESGSDFIEPFQTPPPLQHRSDSHGFVRLHGIVSLELCDRLLEAAKVLPNESWQSLFGQHVTMDAKRHFALAPQGLTAELFGEIEQGCRTLFPDSEPKNWIFMKSLPNGLEQPAHRDYYSIPPDEDLYDYAHLPGSVIVDIDHGSFIYGYGWNRHVALEIEKKAIEVKKGDIIIFRGDFIHGGEDYKKLNYQVHCFLDPTKVKGRHVRKDNGIDLIRVMPKKIPVDENAEQKCYVYRCGLTFSARALLRKHIQGHGFYVNDYPSTITQPKRKPISSQQASAGKTPRASVPGKSVKGHVGQASSRSSQTKLLQQPYAQQKRSSSEMNSPPIGTVRIRAPPVIGTKKNRKKTKVHPLTKANVEFDEYEEKQPVPASGGEKTIARRSMSITPGRLDGYEEVLVPSKVSGAKKPRMKKKKRHDYQK